MQVTVTHKGIDYDVTLYPLSENDPDFCSPGNEYYLDSITDQKLNHVYDLEIIKHIIHAIDNPCGKYWGLMNKELCDVPDMRGVDL